jgi:hypothetical protein
MPAAMDSVIGTALAKDAGARFATCSQLITAAREALAGTRAVAAPVPPPVAPMAGPAPTGEVPADATIPAHRRSSRPPRRTSVLVAGMLGALLLLAAAAFAVVALTADGDETAAPTTPGPTGGPTGSSPTGSSPTISPTDSAAALREYVDRVDGLLAESNEVRLELIDAVTQAGESTAQAQFAVPVVQRVLDARRQELDTVNSWAVPPEASTANSFLSESFRHSLNDDVLYLEYVTLLAEGDRDGASGVLDVIADQNRATDAAKEAFLEEFNRVRIRVGLAPLPGDFKF